MLTKRARLYEIKKRQRQTRSQKEAVVCYTAGAVPRTQSLCQAKLGLEAECRYSQSYLPTDSCFYFVHHLTAERDKQC